MPNDLSSTQKPPTSFRHRVFLKVLPRTRFWDKLYSFLTFLRRHKRIPTNSLLFNDVLYRTKTSNEILDPLRVFVSDKEFIKVYVKAIVGDRFNIPTFKVLRSIEDVDEYDFPPICCIKPTHASGNVILRCDGEPIDRELIKSWFAINYYEFAREANYRALKPKVIVESMVFDNGNAMDYKIFCYKGIPKLIQIDKDRYVNHTRQFFDIAWNELDFSITFPRSCDHMDKPANLDQMLELAAKLSKGFSFVRVDLYSDGNECLVGELTNCSQGAGGFFIPTSAELSTSKMIFN